VGLMCGRWGVCVGFLLLGVGGGGGAPGI
jgi:hypothetical protein